MNAEWPVRRSGNISGIPRWIGDSEGRGSGAVADRAAAA